jgi:uncharacterized membrane protein YkvA (DUF1232 family)
MKSTDRSLHFLRRISRRRPSGQKGVDSIVEYIEQRAARLTPEVLEELRDTLTQLNQQFAFMVTPEFPYLQRQSKLLGTFFADCTDGVFQTAPTATRKEAAFALRYADQKIDIIPDGVAEIGYADDSLIVCTVLNRHHEVFSEYCHFRNISWAGISFGP